METNTVKKTPLYDRHASLGGKIVDFAGWALPVYYTSILEEHKWVRAHCGFFDVSHLGEIYVRGIGAFDYLQSRLTNDLSKLSDGAMQYHLLLTDEGRTVDDLLVYQNKHDEFFIIANASNVDAVFTSLKNGAPAALKIEDQSEQMACIAVQGPDSQRALENLFGFALRDLAYYHFKEERWKGAPVWVSRSGYTGEDGFELFTRNETVVPLWDELASKGKNFNALPAGLGARDTLRLEAGNALYGHELTAQTTPLEAGLGFAVSFDKGNFTGRAALETQKKAGLARKLAGFKMLDKAIAREHYAVLQGGRRVGEVTSGSYGPTAGANIGLAYVEAALASPGTLIDIEIRGRAVPAEIVRRPFVPLRHK